MTVHRNRFLVNKSNRCTEFQSRCTAKNSWWWTKRLLEACRVVIPIKLEFSASVGFIYEEKKLCKRVSAPCCTIRITLQDGHTAKCLCPYTCRYQKGVSGSPNNNSTDACNSCICSAGTQYTHHSLKYLLPQRRMSYNDVFFYWSIPQYCNFSKAQHTLPEDGPIGPKHVGANIEIF